MRKYTLEQCERNLLDDVHNRDKYDTHLFNIILQQNNYKFPLYKRLKTF